jgi:hypothetical protein
LTAKLVCTNLYCIGLIVKNKPRRYLKSTPTIDIHPNGTQMYKRLIRSLLGTYLTIALSCTTIRLYLNASQSICYILAIGSCSKPLNNFTWTKDLFTLRTSHSAVWNRALSESRLFSSSSKPTEVIAYYYRSLYEHEDEDVTITTIVTSNRFEALKCLVEQYQGRASLAKS